MLNAHHHPLFHDRHRSYGPPLTETLIDQAHQRLGVRLPSSLLNTLHLSNGGLLRLSHLDHDQDVIVHELIGLGYPGAIDSDEGSCFLSREWGFPEQTIIFCTSGPRAIALDYRAPGSEPPVVYLDVDENIERRIAPDFSRLCDLLRYPASDLQIALLGQRTLEEMASLGEQLGAEGPAREDWTGAWSLRLPGHLAREPGPALLRIRPNRRRGVDIVPEIEDCNWILESNVDLVGQERVLQGVARLAPGALRL